MRKYARFGRKLRKLPGKRKYARRLEVMRVVYLDMLDMSEHVWTCPDTVDTGVTGALHAKICSGHLSGSGLRKYALRQNHTIPLCSRGPRPSASPVDGGRLEVPRNS